VTQFSGSIVWQKMQEEESNLENVEAGWMFRGILGVVLGSIIVILALLMCVCFKKRRRFDFSY